MAQKLVVSMVLILVFAGLGAGAGLVWPYQRAIFGEHRHQREHGRETVMTETRDDIVQRTLIGAAIGGGMMGMVLMFRKSAGSRGA